MFTNAGISNPGGGRLCARSASASATASSDSCGCQTTPPGARPRFVSNIRIRCEFKIFPCVANRMKSLEPSGPDRVERLEKVRLFARPRLVVRRRRARHPRRSTGVERARPLAGTLAGQLLLRSKAAPRARSESRCRYGLRNRRIFASHRVSRSGEGRGADSRSHAQAFSSSPRPRRSVAALALARRRRRRARREQPAAKAGVGASRWRASRSPPCCRRFRDPALPLPRRLWHALRVAPRRAGSRRRGARASRCCSSARAATTRQTRALLSGAENLEPLSARGPARESTTPLPGLRAAVRRAQRAGSR